MNEKIQSIQKILGVEADGKWGQKSQAALEAANVFESDKGEVFSSSAEGMEVNASSFADPADVAAFLKCKAQGKSDQECFKVGDNGIGFTGINCADDSIPICALPPEEWKAKYGSSKNAAGKPVDVTYEHKTVRGIMGDTMPAIANIKNDARIDLNPGFAKAFGVKPPFMIRVVWKWA